MIASEYINNKTFEKKELIADSGTTSLSYRVCLDGKLYFMKQLRPELFHNLSNRELFHKEYQLGKKIDSNYVVKYHSIHENCNDIYILMEYVYGSTIDEKLKNDKKYFADEYNVYKFLLQLLEGLKAFHSNGIAYVDISPNNIMLTQVGNNVKIIDLGFCFSNEHNNILGSTKNFTAPELQKGTINNIDERTDIFAVGCLMKHIKKNTGAKYSREFYNIITRCTKEDKTKRFSTVDEMIQAIKQCNNKRKNLITFAALLLLPLIYFAISSIYNTPITTISKEGVNYRILSNEEQTCEVTGGLGNKEGNIYIYPKVSINNKLYSTINIVDSAFYKSKIQSVYIPEGIINIGYDVFCDCDSIVTISLPSTVKNIKKSFRRMNNLKAVKISPEIKSITTTSFVDCISLISLYIPEGIERIELDAFGRCTGLKHVSLPQSLKVIERGVFWECKGLEEITIPANVTEIGDYAFYRCDSLKHIYIQATTPPAITTIVDNPKTTIHVPGTSLKAYTQHPYWQQYNITGDL